MKALDRNTKGKVFLLTALLFSGLIFGGIYMTFYKAESTNLVVASPRFPPFSTDPLDIDAMVHHIAFSSVYSTLVSNYKKGELKGILAEAWQHSADYKQWTFKIRPGMLFESGTPISADVIYRNFLRIAYKMKVSGSESGFVEFLAGLNSMKSASDPINGIKLIGDSIQFDFNKPIPRLVSLISFGLYSIVSPKMFDSITGDWIDAHEVDSSGAYSLEKWDQKSVKLNLRPDYPESLRHPKAFKTIEILANSDPSLQSQPHVSIGFSDQKMDHRFNFYGPVNSVIRHIRCYHWDNPNHFFYKKENRILLRDLLFNSMESAGYPLVRSFLPLQVPGIKPLVSESSSNELRAAITINLPNGMQTHDSKSIQLPVQQFFLSSLGDILSNSGGHLSFVDETPPLRPDVTNADLRLMLTDILIDTPADDLRFMFLSGHGIRLPDPTGKIKELIRQDQFDLQTINSLLWEDAIIWPLNHIAFGFWIDSSLAIDFSSYNAAISPVDFRWIGSGN